jgi:hypothetical protein
VGEMRDHSREVIGSWWRCSRSMASRKCWSTCRGIGWWWVPEFIVSTILIASMSDKPKNGAVEGLLYCNRNCDYYDVEYYVALASRVVTASYY